MNIGYIMKKTQNDKYDWSQLEAMTAEQRHAAALSDPDAQPFTGEDLKRMKRTPRTVIFRRVMKLSQEEFSEKFRIPLGTLRDWEQGRKVPDAAARAYLTVIGKNPQAVLDALKPAA
jgi:putative transcriptional regulator